MHFLKLYILYIHAWLVDVPNCHFLKKISLSIILCIFLANQLYCVFMYLPLYYLHYSHIKSNKALVSLNIYIIVSKVVMGWWVWYLIDTCLPKIISILRPVLFIKLWSSNHLKKSVKVIGCVWNIRFFPYYNYLWLIYNKRVNHMSINE